MQKNGNFSKNNVLVIDPDHEFCKNVGMYLEETFNVFIRESIEFLDYTILLNQIQLVLANIDNADPSFLDELTNLKKNHPNLKMIFMYTYLPDHLGIRKKIKQLADSLIAKPFDVELLKIKMECLLKDSNPKPQLDYS